jgi:hypothetical protein
MFDVELFFEIVRVDDPGKIRGTDFVVDHGASDAKTCRSDLLTFQMGPGLAPEFLDDEIELSEFFAGEALFEDRSKLAVFFRKQSEIALGAADIACKNHPFSPYDGFSSV